MNKTIINDVVSSDTQQRPRNVVWTMEGSTPLRMAEDQITLPSQVVILEELQPPAPRNPQVQPAHRRQVFLLLCLLLTSTLAYLVFSGQLKF